MVILIKWRREKFLSSITHLISIPRNFRKLRKNLTNRTVCEWCCLWVSGVTLVVTSCISEPNSTCERRRAQILIISGSKYFGFTSNAHAVTLRSPCVLIQNSMTTFVNMAPVEITRQGEILPTLKTFWGHKNNWSHSKTRWKS